MKITKYLWYVPALYVAYMFGNKIVEGFSHSEEFIAIISVISPLKRFAYTLTPIVGIFDLLIGLALLFNPLVTKSAKIQNFIFTWTILWPFIPASLRYFGGVADFEIVEVLSISFAALVSYILWIKYSGQNK